MSEKQLPEIELTRVDAFVLFEGAIERGELDRAELFAGLLLARNDPPLEVDADGLTGGDHRPIL